VSIKESIVSVMNIPLHPTAEDWGCLVDVKTNESFAHWSGGWVKNDGNMLGGAGGEIVLHTNSSFYKKLLSNNGLILLPKYYLDDQDRHPFTKHDLKGIIFKCILRGEIIGFAKIVRGHIFELNTDFGYASISIKKLDNFEVIQEVTKEHDGLH
jgi:hypothetical protein